MRQTKCQIFMNAFNIMALILIDNWPIPLPFIIILQWQFVNAWLENETGGRQIDREIQKTRHLMTLFSSLGSISLMQKFSDW